MKPGKFGGGGGGMNNMQAMLKKAQKMQEDMLKAQAELEDREYSASSGGGAVTATVKGSTTISSLIIKPEVVDADDVEMLQDLILTAVNAALKEADEVSTAEMSKLTGGAKIPGLF